MRRVGFGAGVWGSAWVTYAYEQIVIWGRGRVNPLCPDQHGKGVARFVAVTPVLVSLNQWQVQTVGSAIFGIVPNQAGFQGPRLYLGGSLTTLSGSEVPKRLSLCGREYLVLPARRHRH